MRTSRTGVAASLAIALVACSGVADDGRRAPAPSADTSPSAKPVVENRQWMDYLHPPDSVADMVAAAVAVVVARYEGAHVTRDTGSDPPSYAIETTYSFTVQEVVKPHGALTGTVELWLPVGEVEYADRIVRSSVFDVTAPADGHTYVIFLGINQRTGDLIGAWSASSLYDITGERVIPGAADGPHAGRPVLEFLDAVRSAAGRRAAVPDSEPSLRSRPQHSSAARGERPAGIRPTTHHRPWWALL